MPRLVCNLFIAYGNGLFHMEIYALDVLSGGIAEGGCAVNKYKDLLRKVR